MEPGFHRVGAFLRQLRLFSWQHGEMQVLRTPEDRFADLPGFGYSPRYADVGELRLAYVEAGPPGGEPVLLLHGEPSWSFLYLSLIHI